MRTVNRLRLYLDTTIPSYVFAVDAPERMEVTRAFMRLRNSSQYEMLISEVVVKEILATAEPKRTLLLEVIADLPVLVLTPQAMTLAQAYIDSGILPRGSIDDARHVAIATLNEVNALVSWNFGHLVNIRRTKAMNALNQKAGLPHLEIITPEEVVLP